MTVPIKPGRGRWARVLLTVALVGVTAIALLALALLRGWGHMVPNGPPPHSAQTVTPETTSSRIEVPVWANLAELEQMLDREIPVDLWTIDQPDATCVAPKHVSLFGARLAITPRMQCHISGVATRGAIHLRGSGRTIIADLPILAHVEARNIGGLISAHADGQAMAHARITIAVTRDWRPGGTIALSYDWTTPPAVMLLGQRVTFTDKADERLKPIIAQLDRKLPQALGRLNLRGQIGQLWRRGFAVIKLNDRAPPVWLRVVPQSLSYGGYTIIGDRMQIRLGLDALTQAVVGPRPPDPPPVPLPDMRSHPVDNGTVHMFVPVIADYAELVPVITRALAKRSARPFNLPGLGPVNAQFSQIEVYGASQGRIAVGADITAVQREGFLPAVHGRIWFAGTPYNQPGSQIVHFKGLSVAASTDDARNSLMVAVANSPGFSDAIANALTQNFTHDYAELQGKIERAVANRRQGVVQIDAHLQSARNGQLAAYANGLYMPVELTGQASVTFAPEIGAPEARQADGR